MDSLPNIRRELRPGDLGAIVAHHGRLYAREHGLDRSFEAHVAASVAAVAGDGWGPRERIWIVELDGGHAGSLGLSDEGDGEGAVRWFLLDPELRGRGLGRRLVGELVGEASELGYERLGLETFGALRAAARIYRDFGFELVWEQIGARWGRDEIAYQRYEAGLSPRPAAFQRLAQERSSESAGSSPRPFGVSA